MNRPDYVLKLADGTERVFAPHPNYDDLWLGFGAQWNKGQLRALGATPVEPEKRKAVWQLVKFWIQGDSPDWANNHKMGFASLEDAENWRLRVESIWPEWTDWEPEEGQLVWWVNVYGGITPTGYIAPIFSDALRTGRLHPTKERAEEWLDKYGKAWGLR